MMPVDEINHIKKNATLLYSEEEIKEAYDRMALSLEQFKTDNPVFLCVVVGGIVTVAELIKRLDYPLEVDYAHATRYRGETTGGDLEWIKKPPEVNGRTVIIVDDILDGGVTLKAIKNECLTQGAKVVHTAVLADKKEGRQPDGLQTADTVGLEVENRYVFGCGMDYKGYLRNVTAIYAVSD